MNEDALQQLEKEMQQLQAELQATQTKLQHLAQRLQQLQPDARPKPGSTFFKTPYTPRFTTETFIGLRLIHLVGIVVLVIGLSIGVKYVIDREFISEGARIALAYAAGLLLFILSWRLQKKYAAFSAILFSGAMASLYFTTYAAFVYYGLFSFALVFALLVLLTVFTVYKALAYNRQEIAILGLVGAYGIPFFISSNTGRAELLFMYIALINTAIVFLSFKKNWKVVALLAQGITWLLLVGWMLTRYTAVQQKTAYFFATFFFILFSTQALASRMVKKEALQRWQVQEIFVNNILLYAIIAMVYQAAAGHVHFSNLNAGFSIFTALQAAAVYYLFRSETYLKKGLALFALFFFLLFLANRWEGFVVTLLWLLTAVVIFSVGVGLKAIWLRLSGMVLMGLTLAKLVLLDSQRFSTVQKIIAYLTLGVLLLIVGYFYQRFREKLFHDENTNAA